MRIVDLSAPIAPSHPGAASYERVEIRTTSHAGGAAQIQGLLGVPPDLLRNGEGWAIEEFTSLGTHSVTHVDAPWHYNSTIQGERAATIDELPLEWFFGDGVVLDMTRKQDGERVEAAEVEAALAETGHTLRPLDIVLVRTGRDIFYGQPGYAMRGCAISAEATRWLYERGVRVMGIDAWGWDGPLDRQAREALERQQPGVFWAAHQCDLPYSQIERLVNLGALPPHGFKVACFPSRSKGEAPARREWWRSWGIEGVSPHRESKSIRLDRSMGTSRGRLDDQESECGSGAGTGPGMDLDAVDPGDRRGGRPAGPHGSPVVSRRAGMLDVPPPVRDPGRSVPPGHGDRSID